MSLTPAFRDCVKIDMLIKNLIMEFKGSFIEKS